MTSPFSLYFCCVWTNCGCWCCLADAGVCLAYFIIITIIIIILFFGSFSVILYRSHAHVFGFYFSSSFFSSAFCVRFALFLPFFFLFLLLLSMYSLPLSLVDVFHLLLVSCSPCLSSPSVSCCCCCANPDEEKLVSSACLNNTKGKSGREKGSHHDCVATRHSLVNPFFFLSSYIDLNSLLRFFFPSSFPHHLYNLFFYLHYCYFFTFLW